MESKTRDRTRYLALLAGLSIVLVPLFASVKPVPQGIILGLFAVNAALGGRSRRVPAVLLSLLLCAAAITACTMALLWVFPAVTAEGHGLMPIGQTLGGLVLGAVSGVLLSVAFLRMGRDPALERHVLNLLGAALLGAAVLERYPLGR